MITIQQLTDAMDACEGIYAKLKCLLPRLVEHGLDYQWTVSTFEKLALLTHTDWKSARSSLSLPKPNRASRRAAKSARKHKPATTEASFADFIAPLNGAQTCAELFDKLGAAMKSSITHLELAHLRIVIATQLLLMIYLLHAMVRFTLDRGLANPDQPFTRLNGFVLAMMTALVLK